MVESQKYVWQIQPKGKVSKLDHGKPFAYRLTYSSPAYDRQVNSFEEACEFIPNLEVGYQIGAFKRPYGPSAFTRVLGFRFTNSIVKLAQAFSFLRGKEYVGRQDILDAVPYCLAHRLGRAKAGALDLQGNNKGLDGSTIKYVNEQEFLREVLVRGYIQNKGVTTGVGQEGQNLLDNFDLFYQRCRDVLASVPSVWQYERDVLLPLHQEIKDSSESSLSEITPVHWHIATMVVEEERMATNASGSTNKPQRSYTVENAGVDGSYSQLGDYNSMYSYFQNLILDPTGSDKEPILFDYYAVRGIIARDVLIELDLNYQQEAQ